MDGINTPVREETRYAMPIDSESLPNDLRLGSSVANTVNTTRNVRTNSMPKICHALSWSCATEMPNGPIPEWPVTDTLQEKDKNN